MVLNISDCPKIRKDLEILKNKWENNKKTKIIEENIINKKEEYFKNKCDKEVKTIIGSHQGINDTDRTMRINMYLSLSFFILFIIIIFYFSLSNLVLNTQIIIIIILIFITIGTFITFNILTLRLRRKEKLEK